MKTNYSPTILPHRNRYNLVFTALILCCNVHIHGAVTRRSVHWEIAISDSLEEIFPVRNWSCLLLTRGGKLLCILGRWQCRV